jgi:pimeloyl-ACP methyl ester carboxylesterase
MKSFIYLTLIALLFTGCSAKQEYQLAYDKHIDTFKKVNTFKTHKIKRGKHILIAREFGKEYEGKAPTILLMHGFPDSQHLYDELIPYLSKKRHVISFDYLGWGDSDKPYSHTYNTESLKEDMQTVIDYFRLDNMVIVCHDASGPPAIDWSLEHQSKVASLVLLNTYYYPMKSLVPPEAIALFSTPSVKRTITIALAKSSDSVWQSGMVDQLNKFMNNEKMRNRYTKIFAHQALGIRPAFLGLNDVLNKETEARRATAKQQLATFKKPVKIIFGDDDPYLNSGVAKEFHTLFPHSTLHLIKGGAHYVQIDKPKEVARYILK